MRWHHIPVDKNSILVHLKAERHVTHLAHGALWLALVGCLIINLRLSDRRLKKPHFVDHANEGLHKCIPDIQVTSNAELIVSVVRPDLG